MKYSSSSILLERAQRMKVNRIGKLFSSLKTIINGLFSCFSLKWSLIFNAISVFMQITCKQLIGLVYVWTLAIYFTSSFFFLFSPLNGGDGDYSFTHRKGAGNES